MAKHRRFVPVSGVGEGYTIMDRLSIRHSSPVESSFLRLELSGELDVVNVGKLCDTVVDMIEKGERRLLLDLSGITWCDAASLYTILGIRHAVTHAGGSLVLTAASPPVDAALQRTGLRQLLPIAPI